MRKLIVPTASCCVLLKILAGDVAPPASRIGDLLIQKCDTNGNGKIDVDERKGYIRERAKRLREDAKLEAALRPVVPPEVRLFLSPPQWTKEKVAKYDANRNGRLEPEERAQERQNAVKVAEEKFRKADGNGDGRLDAKERQAAVRAE